MKSQFDTLGIIHASKEKNTLSQQKIICIYQQQTEHLCKLQCEHNIKINCRSTGLSLFWKKKSQVEHCFQFCHFTVFSFVILLFEKITLFFELAHLSNSSIPTHQFSLVFVWFRLLFYLVAF